LTEVGDSAVRQPQNNPGQIAVDAQGNLVVSEAKGLYGVSGSTFFKIKGGRAIPGDVHNKQCRTNCSPAAGQDPMHSHEGRLNSGSEWDVCERV
jgi:hypothetical protein